MKILILLWGFLCPQLYCFQNLSRLWRNLNQNLTMKIKLIVLGFAVLCMRPVQAGYVYECEINSKNVYQATICPEAKRQTTMCIDGYRMPSAPDRLGSLFEDCKQIAELKGGSSIINSGGDSNCIK